MNRWPLYLLAAALVAAVLFQALPALADPIAIAQAGDITVTLTDEPCALEAVANLPRRATWDQAGKHFEGCYGVSGPMVLAYFEDRTVAAIPLQVVRPAEGT